MNNGTRNSIGRLGLMIAITLALVVSGPASAQDKKPKSADQKPQPVVAQYQQEATPVKNEKKLEKEERKPIRNDHTRKFWNQKFKFVSF